jgi:hypothetical protein
MNVQPCRPVIWQRRTSGTLKYVCNSKLKLNVSSLLGLYTPMLKCNSFSRNISLYVRRNLRQEPVYIVTCKYVWHTTNLQKYLHTSSAVMSGARQKMQCLPHMDYVQKHMVHLQKIADYIWQPARRSSIWQPIYNQSIYDGRYTTETNTKCIHQMKIH